MTKQKNNWECDKTENMTILKNSKSDEPQKTKIVTKLKKSYCDETQNWECDKP